MFISKRIPSAVALAVISLAVFSIATVVSAPAISAESETDKAFYFMGTSIGRDLGSLELTEAESAAILEGLAETLAGTAQELDEAVYGPQLNQIIQQRTSEIAAREGEASQGYLAAMKAEDGAEQTATGLVYLQIKEGEGKQAERSSTVKAHYTGTLRDGTVFDSSRDRGEPLTIPLNQVIPCWTEAISMMKEGGQSKITCPPDIAYGDRATGIIPPGSVLTFQVELIEVM